MIDGLFWWTGCFLWLGVASLAVVWGLPDGDAHRGITRLTFYGFGPVLWRVTPENKGTFTRLKECGYHFAHLRGDLHLGLSLPTWLSRRLHRSKP